MKVTASGGAACNINIEGVQPEETDILPYRGSSITHHADGLKEEQGSVKLMRSGHH